MSTRKYGILQVREDFTWRVSDCEELVGVTHKKLLGQSLVTAPVRTLVLRKSLH